MSISAANQDSTLDQVNRIRALSNPSSPRSSQSPLASPRSPRPIPDPPPPEPSLEDVKMVVKAILTLHKMALAKPFTYETSKIASSKSYTPILNLKDDLYVKYNLSEKSNEVIRTLALKKIHEMTQHSRDFFNKLEKAGDIIKLGPSYSETDRDSLIKMHSKFFKALVKRDEIAKEYFELFSSMATTYFETLKTYENRHVRRKTLVEMLSPRKSSTPRALSQPDLRGRANSKSSLEEVGNLYDQIS